LPDTFAVIFVSRKGLGPRATNVDHILGLIRGQPHDDCGARVSNRSQDADVEDAFDSHCEAFFGNLRAKCTVNGGNFEGAEAFSAVICRKNSHFTGAIIQSEVLVRWRHAKRIGSPTVLALLVLNCRYWDFDGSIVSKDYLVSDARSVEYPKEVAFAGRKDHLETCTLMGRMIS